MKKLITGILIFTTLTNIGYTQGFYLRLGLGYAIPQAGQTLDGTSQPYNGSLNDSTLQYKVKNTSFSAGLGTFVGVGYMFNEHVGVQLDGNLGISTKQYSFTESNYNYQGVLSNVTVQQQAKSPFIVIPSLVLHSGGDKIDLYCRMGLALPISTKITQNQIIVNAPGTGALTENDISLSVTSSFSLGFAAAGGLNYNISDKIKIWGEISLLSLAPFIKEADITAASYNGQPQSITGAPTYKFSKNIAVDSNGYNSPAYAQPFSNVGINFGITFQLSKGSNHSSGRKGNNEDIDPNKPFRRR